MKLLSYFLSSIFVKICKEKSKMRIEKSNGKQIQSLADWSRLYDSPKTVHHWKEGRSVYSIAQSVLKCDGCTIFQDRISGAIGQGVVFDRVVPKYGVRFDEFGCGRVHDLAMFGTTDKGETVFVGIEAKVDETFGPAVQDYYLAAKAKQITGSSTNTPERIEKLLSIHFSKPEVSMFDVRYQLLYATAGTLAAGADISFLYVAVFKTDLYDGDIGAKNHWDYKKFISKIGAKPVPLNNDDRDVSVHHVVLQNKPLICIHEYFKL